MKLTRRRLLSLGAKMALVAPVAALVAPMAAQAAPEAPIPVESTLGGIVAGGQQRGPLARIKHAELDAFLRPEPLGEGVPPRPLTPDIVKNGGLTWVTPKIMHMPINSPTWDDPLGQYGFVAVKYRLGGNTYGDWIKLTTDDEDVVRGAFDALRTVSYLKLARIDPNACFTRFNFPA